jgi:S-DNA-T family DNA segregation ATPase FtsK/SpoIIIE
VITPSLPVVPSASADPGALGSIAAGPVADAAPSDAPAPRARRRDDDASAASSDGVRPPVAEERDRPSRPTRRTSARPGADARQSRLPLEAATRGWSLPPLELLAESEPQLAESEQELVERARLTTEKLREFAVHGSVVAIHPGPVVTTFEFKPDSGVKYSKVTGMTDDLSLALRAESVRIARIPGRATVGIEVPNRRQQIIYPRELLASPRFRESESMLTLVLGKTINGEPFTAELDRMPHLLIAGATGSGKSVGLNTMITSLLYKATPDDVRMIMIDTKMIELGIYEGIPHLLIPVVTEPKKASTALRWAVREMEARYRKLAAVGVRNLAQFNDLVGEEPARTLADPRTGEEAPLAPLPAIVIVIDELADLMMVSSADVEESIMRLAQMARAVGIHLIIATQRPSVDVITGTIKANFPSRIAFRVSQRVDSRTIIDQQGAEHLLGRGDMLFLKTGTARLVRVHGCLITEAELHRITSFLKKQAEPVYDESIHVAAGGEAGGVTDPGERDERYEDAVRTVIQEGKCSVTLIQRRLQLGYARAARIVDMMERNGVVGPGEGSKPREVLVGREHLEA